MRAGIAYSSNTWFILWISLEINMIAFIPIIFSQTSISLKSIIKYFVIQSFARSLFLIRRILSDMRERNQIFSELVRLALLTKLGIFPLYFWFPDVREGLSWHVFFILCTWQKLIPLIILRCLWVNLTFISILIRGWIGCLGILNLTSLRKILAFSSINNLAWIVIRLINPNINWLLFLIVYRGVILRLIIIIKFNNLASLPQIINFSGGNFNKRFLFLLLSLGGLPPLVGFFPKWIIISRIRIDAWFLIINLLITRLISIFIYLRILLPQIINYYVPSYQRTPIFSTASIPLSILTIFVIIPLLAL